MRSNDTRYDVCVVGGGPAGSTAATFMAMRGHRVLLIEKELVPVYKIGESLLPATVHGICAMLGVVEELNSHNFIRKLGGTFRWGKSRAPWTFTFAESSRFQGPTSHAYQVERIKFDKILLDNAIRKGVEVWEQHRVQDLLFDNDRVSGIRLFNNAGEEIVVGSTYVVDASGHTSTIARHAGKRIFSKFFRNLALFGYFKNAGRLPAPNSGNIFCAAFEKGWFWYIPLSDMLTSVGAIIGQEYSSLLQKGHERAFSELVSNCGPIKDLLSNASPCKDAPYNEIRVRTDYSYSHSSFWRPGLILIGDAACFIDPVFSSGVHLATYSALLAARSINTYFENPSSEEIAFKEFEMRYRREYKVFYDFLTAFYDLDQDLESYYWTARVLMHSEIPGNQAFLNLVGGDASGELLNSVNGKPEDYRARGSRIFPDAAGLPSDKYAESGSPPNEKRKLWSELNAEGFKLQLRGAMKGAPVPEQPLFKNGLVPSRDGLSWTHSPMPAAYR
jgi:halogenation protein CepH